MAAGPDLTSSRLAPCVSAAGADRGVAAATGPGREAAKSATRTG